MDQHIVQGCVEAIIRIDSILKQLDSQDHGNARYFHAFGLMFRIAETQNGSARIRMTDVSEYLHVTKPAATYIVKQLVEHGLVRRINDKSDKRITYIELTDEGRLVFDQSMEQRLSYIARASDRMGAEKIREFGRLFNEFLDVMDAEMRDS